MEFAKTFYNNLLLRRSQNLPLTKATGFANVANDLSAEDQRMVDRGERAASLVNETRNLLTADILPFFSHYQL